MTVHLAITVLAEKAITLCVLGVNIKYRQIRHCVFAETIPGRESAEGNQRTAMGQHSECKLDSAVCWIHGQYTAKTAYGLQRSPCSSAICAVGLLNYGKNHNHDYFGQY